jgi:hypothetical protein
MAYSASAALIDSSADGQQGDGLCPESKLTILQLHRLHNWGARRIGKTLGLPTAVVIETLAASQQDRPHADWESRPVEQQRAILVAMDPVENPQSCFTASEWNRHHRRIQNLERQWTRGLESLQRRCYCVCCVNFRRLPFPSYYVRRGKSYECHLEDQQDDREKMERDNPGLAEELAALEGANRRRGEPRARVRDFG